MARLTPKSVEAERPTRQRREIPDAGAAGLYLVVQPTGGKSWAARYRFDGKPIKLALGKYPIMSLAEARSEVADVKAKVERGIDPAAERRAEKAAEVPNFVTVLAAFEDYKKKKLATMKSGAVTGRELQRHFVSVWSDRDIAGITRRDIIERRDDIGEDGLITTANNTTAYLSAFLTWCLDRELVPANNALRIKKKPGEKTRDRVLSDDELRRFMKACQEVRDPWGDLGMVLLLTGQRLNEIACMSTLEVVGKMLELPSDRTKNGRPHDVPLSDAVIEVLGRRPCVPVPKKKHGYYFTTNDIAPVSGFSKARLAIHEKMGEDVPHWTFHDLRRTLATRMEGMGVPISVTEAILNHVSGSKSGIVGIYQRHQYAVEKREALDAWAEELARIEAAG